MTILQGACLSLLDGWKIRRSLRMMSLDAGSGCILGVLRMILDACRNCRCLLLTPDGLRMTLAGCCRLGVSMIPGVLSGLSLGGVPQPCLNRLLACVSQTSLCRLDAMDVLPRSGRPMMDPNPMTVPSRDASPDPMMAPTIRSKTNMGHIPNPSCTRGRIYPMTDAMSMGGRPSSIPKVSTCKGLLRLH